LRARSASVFMRRSMSNAMSGYECDILHVRPAPADDGRIIPDVQAMEAILASVPLKTHVYPDVYRALARLCASQAFDLQEAPRTCAVVVCMDDVGPAELEFFTLLKRVRPGLPVYVYGDGRLESKLAEAVKLGAAGPATEAVIRSITAEAEQPTIESHREFDEPAQVDVAPIRHADAETAPESFVESEALQPSPSNGDEQEIPDDYDSLPTSDTLAESDDSDPQPAGQPVRVPWLRYGDRPTRKAPTREAPRPPQRPPAEPSPRDLPDIPGDEPLLTSAELEALLGDDIAAIAPKGRQRSDAPRHRDEEESP